MVGPHQLRLLQEAKAGGAVVVSGRAGQRHNSALRLADRGLLRRVMAGGQTVFVLTAPGQDALKRRGG